MSVAFPSLSGVILAGGRSMRLGGISKGLIEVGGQRIVDRLLGLMRPRFAELVVAGGGNDTLRALDAPVVPDVLDARTPLTGIHAGLTAVTTTHALVVACDLPFLSGEVMDVLAGSLTPDADVIVPLHDNGYMEPLCAIYSRRCLEPIVRMVGEGVRKTDALFSEVRTVMLPEARFRGVDPELRSFLNVNTPDDLAVARRLSDLS